MIRLRHARGSDAVDFYRWRNDPDTQRFTGIPTMKLTWEQHLDWFCEGVVSPHWYVAEDSLDAQPVGALRYDRAVAEPAWWVSIVLDPQQRGKGYGTELLRQPIADLERAAVLARIHQLNAPSIRAFEKAGYVLDMADESVWRVYRRVLNLGAIVPNTGT